MRRILGLAIILICSRPLAGANLFTGDPDCVAVWTMDALTAEKNITASASTGTAAWRAFDGTTVQWSTTVGNEAPSWVMIDLNTGREKPCAKYDVQASTTTAPNTWTFDGYNGSGYTVLDSQSGQAGWGSNETRTFTFSNTTAYQGYRLSISANNGGTTSAVTNLNIYALATDNVKVMRDLAANTTLSGTHNDLVGTNHLAAFAYTALPAVDTSVKKEGTASFDFETTGNENHLFIPDNKLAADFPLKAGTTNYTFSVTFWMMQESQVAAYRTIWGKTCDSTAALDGTGCWTINDDIYFEILFGGSYYGVVWTAAGIAVAEWHFIAQTFDYATGTARQYIWDDTATAILQNATTDLSAYGAPDLSGNDFGVSGFNPRDDAFDGRLDEFTVWKRALSVDDIEKIRTGTYVSSSTSELIGAGMYSGRRGILP